MKWMTDRERFLATMHYQARDRAPICDFGFWPETLDKWRLQGLPEVPSSGDRHNLASNFFGMDSYHGGPGVNVHTCPGLKHEVVEDRGEQVVVRNSDGVLLLQDKYSGSIPIHLDHLLKDRASWEEHFKPRLNPDNPARYPDWDKARANWADEGYDRIRVINGGSLFGWIRNWMGLEGVSFLVHDDPALFEEMVETITDCIVECHRRMFEAGAKVDGCSMWEDMCYNSGPLLGVEHFKKYLMPQYRRITEQLNRHGCDIIWLDCDGMIDHLLPLWLEVGVNCMFPIEVGTWKADPVKYRRQYGRELLMMGGFDKRILAHSKQAISDEVDRLTPLVEEGGFIPFCDHRVPPDVSLENYMHYLRCARSRWGLDHPSLKPLGTLVSPQPTA